MGAEKSDPRRTAATLRVRMRIASALLFIALAGIATGCGKTAPTQIDQSAADRERLQGDWIIEKIDAGVSPEKTARLLKEAGQVRFRFEAETFSILSKDEEEKRSFTLSTKSDPKRLTTHEPETPTKYARDYRWIYKFEGDLLVLARRLDMIDDSPSSFQAKVSDKGEPQVMIVWLRRVKQTETEKGSGNAKE